MPAFLRPLYKVYKYLANNGVSALWQKFKQRLYEESLDYDAWAKSHLSSQDDLAKQRERKFSYMPLISIIVPVFRTPKKFLSAMLESVIAQSYTHWELCLAVPVQDASSLEVIENYKDGRIRVRKTEENLGIAGNSNVALAVAQGDYVAFLDHDDLLTPDALYEVAYVLQEKCAAIDIIYTDEDQTDEEGSHFFHPHFKPGFSLELLRACNYICHLLVVRRAFLSEKGISFRIGFDGAQDYDFILRIAEKAREIRHIPRVLYHWRTHLKSTAAGSTNKPYAHEAGRLALKEHLKRMGINGTVEDGFGMAANFYHVEYNPQPAKISVLLLGDSDEKVWPTRWETIRNVTDWQDLEIIQDNSLSLAVKRAKGRWIAVLDADALPEEGDWLYRLLGVCQEGGAALVGGKIIGANGPLEPIGWLRYRDGFMACYEKNDPKSFGYMCRLFARQELSAINPHLIFFSRHLYEKFAADTSISPPFFTWQEEVLRFSLAVSGKGLRVVFDPFVRIKLHNEPNIEPPISNDGYDDGLANKNYDFFGKYFPFHPVLTQY